MKEKAGKILKSRMFLCVIVAIVFGIIGVSAATYFPSGDVTYDNTESGLKSTDVQGAIDELYNTCSSSAIIISSEQIKKQTVTTGDGLYADDYEIGRYIYKGANPNNYIFFNGELWRILSLESDGTIKIIKYGLYTGAYKWSSSSSNNTWLNSLMQKNLNNEYLNNLSDKNQIVSHSFNVGKITNDNNDLKAQIVAENSTTWNGKVGLITASEYLRANSNKSECATLYLNNNNFACTETNWIYQIWDKFHTRTDEVFFIITAGSNSGVFGFLPQESKYKLTLYNPSLSNSPVCPTVYLTKNIRFIGKGTITRPFYIVD